MANAEPRDTANSACTALLTPHIASHSAFTYRAYAKRERTGACHHATPRTRTTRSRRADGRSSDSATIMRPRGGVSLHRDCLQVLKFASTLQGEPAD